MKKKNLGKDKFITGLTSAIFSLAIAGMGLSIMNKFFGKDDELTEIIKEKKEQMEKKND